MPMEIFDDTFKLNMFDDIMYDNLHCTNNEELRSENNNNCGTINHDEEKSDELFNSEENNETVTMNNENKAGKSENSINADNSIIIENIRTGIKTSNLSESSIDI